MVTANEIRAMLHPSSFALIGASDRSTFSTLVHSNLLAAGFDATTYLVNPRSDHVHGRRTYPTCAEIGRPVDLAFVMVPVAHVNESVQDAAAAGARAAVVLSSGFAEMGADGRARQDELVRVAEELGVVALGPNVLGFVNVAGGVPAMVLANPPTAPGPVALLSQSGASCAAMKDFAHLAGVGLSYVITVGNEAMVTVGHLVDYLVDDDQTRAIAVFLEGIRQPETFAAAAGRAAAAGKALVVLKAGRSELAARAAATHTGALVGDDRVVNAVFDRLGVIRVDTIEDMLVTAGIAAHTGPLVRPGIGVVSISGGACDIVADLAQDAGAALPELSQDTVERLQDVLPAYGHVQNPLDITGAALADPSIWSRSVEAVGTDPRVGVVMAINSLPLGDAVQPFYGQKFVDAIGLGMGKSDAPSLYLTQVIQPIGAAARHVLASAGVPHVVPGLRLGVDAVARIAAWSRRRVPADEHIAPVTTRPEVDLGPCSEVRARSLLESAGVPVVPARHVHSPAAAARAAAELGGPVAMKIVSADITHKTDLGCVRLGVAPADAGRAFEEIVTAASAPAANGARLDGVLVSPMRDQGTELLVGVTRDRDWGLVLAVGVGGVLVEVLDDVALAPLPVSAALARNLLERLRGAALLRGVRGRPATNLEHLAEVVAAVGLLAGELEPYLDSLEVNPLRVHGDEVEALDALVVWRH